MKLLLIKAGKAYNTIKRDGLFRGGKRVFQAISALFGRVQPGDLLYIAGGVGDSSRYGCHHQAEELGFQGIKCAVTVQDNPFLTSYADKFKVFIFHRTLFTPSVAKLIEKIKKQGKTILYATDDLVFDPQYVSQMNYLDNANKFEKMLYENGVGGEILQDPSVVAAVTTTSFLADKLEEYVQEKRTAQGVQDIKFQTFISTNKMSQQDVDLAQGILQNKKRRKDQLIKIGYFSGTISHNKDFAQVTGVLLLLLEKYSQLRLVLVGPLDVENRLHKYAKQIEHLPFASREQHFANIASVDINIAPLEIENPFCQAKSELKFFEAGLVKVPSVVAATRTFQEAVIDGKDGFVAGSAAEWQAKLEKLIQDESLRMQMAEQAYKKVLEKYVTAAKGNQDYYQFLKQALA